MNYIDADKLIAEIKKRKDIHRKNYEEFKDERFINDECEDDRVLSLITSLQQEQPKLKPMNIPSGGGAMGTTPPKFKLEVKKQPVVKKSNALFDECVKNCDPAIMKEVSDNVDKILASEELEKEIEKWLKGNPAFEDEPCPARLFKYCTEATARHFAEWGRKQILQEIYEGKVKPVDKITAAWLDDERNT